MRLHLPNLPCVESVQFYYIGCKIQYCMKTLYIRSIRKSERPQRWISTALIISLTSSRNSLKLSLVAKSLNALTLSARVIFVVRKLLTQQSLSSWQALLRAQDQALQKFSWLSFEMELSVSCSEMSAMRNLSARRTASSSDSIVRLSKAEPFAASNNVLSPSFDVFFSLTRRLPDSEKLPSSIAEKASERWQRTRRHASTVVPSSNSNVTVDGFTWFSMPQLCKQS